MKAKQFFELLIKFYRNEINIFDLSEKMIMETLDVKKYLDKIEEEVGNERN